MTGSPMAGMFAAGRGIRSIGWCEEYLIMTETNLNVSESLQNIIGWEKQRVLLLAVLMPILTGENDAAHQLWFCNRPLAKKGAWVTYRVHCDISTERQLEQQAGACQRGAGTGLPWFYVLFLELAFSRMPMN